jgi:endoglucanase
MATMLRPADRQRTMLRMTSPPCVRLIFLAVVCLSVSRLAASAQQKGIAPPLHTSGHRILDAAGNAVRLTSVNWYGFDEKEYVAGGLDHAPLGTIVEEIKRMGVNSVRLPWANETLEHNPIVPDYAVAANPQFKGKHAMEVMDAVITALAQDHIMVILDNHVSRADWCCSDTDGNGLWYNWDYPETRWVEDWRTIAHRYRSQRWVVGADLRNELRSGAAWGGADPKLDWHSAAERGGNTVLAANPRLLIMVESPEYSTNFVGFDKLPVQLAIPNRLVYSPHAYNIEGHAFSSYEELKEVYDARAGFLLNTKPGVPLWVGEFGVCQTLDCGANSEWFKLYIRYLKEHELVSWSYWPLNGTQSSGEGRKYDTPETYGLLSTDYRTIEAPKIVDLLRTIEDQPPR